MNFDPTKPVQTRDGRKARIICTDANSIEGYYIVYMFDNGYGNEIIGTCDLKGRYYGDTKDHVGDLINILGKHVRYLCFYESSAGEKYAVTRPLPEKEGECVACKRVEIEIGQYDK